MPPFYPFRLPADNSVCSGIEYPVHPLDLTRIQSDVFTIDGKQQNATYCSNSFDYGQLAWLDAILGDPFLKNVYAS